MTPAGLFTQEIVSVPGCGDPANQSFNKLSLALFSATFYLLLVLFLYRSIVSLTGGRFLYSLDDPYIHLALAEQLSHGHYGINATEFSSPSSSILWPFLLIPGAGTHFHQYMPLVWNLVFGLIAAFLLGWQVGKWPPQLDERGRMEWWKQGFTAVMLVFVANLGALTLLGMEHVLQVLLAICCAIGMIEAISSGKIPAWCLAAAVLAPCVRYEDFALTLAVSLTLIGLGRWRGAVLLFALSLVPVIGFSVYLRSKGLPLLPMSVLVKGNAYAHASLLLKVISQLKDSIRADLIDPERYPIGILFLLFAGLAWRADTTIRRYVYGAAALLGLLQLIIGRFGWFHRYEVYALIFLTLLSMRVLSEKPRFLFGYFALGLVFCASSYIKAAADTSTAAREVYYQQYQMHRFVTEYYSGNYAVNDLGWTSFERPSGSYVLDVYGLASAEASSHPEKSAAWLDGIVKRYDVPLAMLYPDWFHIPPEWEPLATMCLPKQPILDAYQCVVFYNTGSARRDEMRAELERFSFTLPSEVVFHLMHGFKDDALLPQGIH